MKKRGLKLAAVVMALAMVPAVVFAYPSPSDPVRDNSNTTSSTDNTFSGGTSSSGSVTQGSGQVVGTTTTATTTTTGSTVSQSSNVITAGNGETVSATATSTQTTATGESVTTGSVTDVTTDNGSKITYAGNATVTVESKVGDELIGTNIKVLSGSEVNTANVSTELSTLRQAVSAGTSTDAATAAVKAEGYQSTGITENVFMTDVKTSTEVSRNTEYGYVCSGLKADAQVRVVFVNNNGTTQVLNVTRVGDILYFVLPASGQITIYVK